MHTTHTKQANHTSRTHRYFMICCDSLPHSRWGTQNNMFWKGFRWVGWVSGPGKGLEGLKIGHDIILCSLLKLGNLGTKIFM